MYLLDDLLSLNIKPESSPRQTIPKRKIKIDVMIIVSIFFMISTKYNMNIYTKDILVFNSSQFAFIFLDLHVNIGTMVNIFLFIVDRSSESFKKC